MMESENPSHSSCPNCNGGKFCSKDGEVCCTGCGAVMGRDYNPEQFQSESRLNLFQVLEVGTKKVGLECARHVHEPSSDISKISNACVKLDMPIYAAKDVHAIYQKITRQKCNERIEYAKKLNEFAELAKAGLVDEEKFFLLKRTRPRCCTRAHTAAYAVHLVCKKYGLPRSDVQILDAVWMNFGAKRKFTILKAYSLNEITAREVGIDCSNDKAAYYVRLLLSRLQDKIGTGMLYDRIMRQAVANLQKIQDRREDVRAHRALDLALRGAKFYVQI